MTSVPDFKIDCVGSLRECLTDADPKFSSMLREYWTAKHRGASLGIHEAWTTCLLVTDEFARMGQWVEPKLEGARLP